MSNSTSKRGPKAKKLKIEEPILENSGLTQTIAEHYNKIDDKDLKGRRELRLFFMKNFNNWIKSVIIRKAFEQIEENNRSFYTKLNVMDLGCGKGGDLKKYTSHPVQLLVCIDIAEDSITSCKSRYGTMVSPNFQLETIHADVTRVPIINKLFNPSTTFQLVASQFSFHYCFESMNQAQCMLKNVSQRLDPGGVFIGTTPDAYEIVKRLRQSDTNSFGNDVFRITFPDDFDKDNVPLFGAKYNFYLKDSVDCPEFLVYFPLLEKLAANHKLKLILCERFDDFFQSNHKQQERLLKVINALEIYSPESRKLRGNKSDYNHAQNFINEHKAPSCGTLSYPEWEAISLYLVFMFEKQK